METIAEWMLRAIKNRGDSKSLNVLRDDVKAFALRFPLPSDLRQ